MPIGQFVSLSVWTDMDEQDRQDKKSYPSCLSVLVRLVMKIDYCEE